MQRIRMKTLSATPERTLQAEQIGVVPDEEALALIAGGFAVPVDRLGNDVLIPAQDLAALREELLNGLAVTLSRLDDEDQDDEPDGGDGGEGQDDEPDGGDGGEGQDDVGDEKTPADPDTTPVEEQAPDKAEQEPDTGAEDPAKVKARRQRRSRET